MRAQAHLFLSGEGVPIAVEVYGCEPFESLPTIDALLAEGWTPAGVHIGTGTLLLVYVREVPVGRGWRKRKQRGRLW